MQPIFGYSGKVPAEVLPSQAAIEGLVSKKSTAILGKVLEYPILTTFFVYVSTMALTKLTVIFCDKMGFTETKKIIKEIYVMTNQYSQIRTIALVVALLFSRIFPIASFILAALVGINSGLIMDFSEKQKELEIEAKKLSK